MNDDAGTEAAEAPAPVTVIVLAYGSEPLLADCLQSVRASIGIRPQVVLVDNGCTRTDLDCLSVEHGASLLRPGRNTGFALGCNLAAQASEADYIALVNSDAVVEPTALFALCRALADPAVWLATGLVVLHEQPDIVNAAGNPVHWSMLSWAGGFGEPVRRHEHARDVASASGALLMMRRRDWSAFGGLGEMHFAYGEDAELSLRAWLAGGRVRFEPAARARHAYAFSRSPRKMYLLERNRWINLLTLYDRRSLAMLLPGLALLELALVVVAVRDGWFDQKTEAWAWLLRHRADIRRRRAVVQGTRRRGDAILFSVLSDRIEPGLGTGMRVPVAMNTLLALQGRLARGLAGMEKTT